VLLAGAPTTNEEASHGVTTTRRLKLIHSAAVIHQAGKETELELRSSPKWFWFSHLRVNDEAVSVRVRRQSREFRWRDIAWVGWSDPVGLSKGDKLYLGIGLLLGLLLRDSPAAPITSAHAAVLRVAPKGSALATPGPNNPHVFVLATWEEDVAATVRSYLGETALRAGVEFRPSPKQPEQR
jgi:hypothetical protein